MHNPFLPPCSQNSSTFFLNLLRNLVWFCFFNLKFQFIQNGNCSGIVRGKVGRHLLSLPAQTCLFSMLLVNLQAEQLYFRCLETYLVCQKS